MIALRELQFHTKLPQMCVFMLFVNFIGGFPVGLLLHGLLYLHLISSDWTHFINMFILIRPVFFSSVYVP